MHPTQSQLFADHHNFMRLLRCLETEVSHYENNEPQQANLPVILDIFDYVQFYPEQYHHPVEDALFRRLLLRQVPESDHIWMLKAEHKTLESLTHRTRQLFNSVASDSVVPVGELVATTREFLDRQMEHINRENRIVYPRLSEYVGPEEWDEITAEVTGRNDPLFGRGIIEEYEELYYAIVKAERHLATGATARAINKPRAVI